MEITTNVKPVATDLNSSKQGAINKLISNGTDN